MPHLINTAALYFTDRLIKNLHAIDATPLTLVEAPMGYGKTVAVREYLRKRKARTVWASVLSTGEDSFWREFCRTLAVAFPENADTVESLARVGYPRDAVLVDAARELLLQLDFCQQTILVVDDIHLLTDVGNSGGMAQLCALLARQELNGLRIVLISRDLWTGKHCGRAVLALKGQLGVIDRETLALNAEEIREYFALCGLRITPQEAAGLYEVTGGWISALYLYLLRYSKDGELSLPKAPLQQSLVVPESIGALLEEEIFFLLPEKAKALLFALSPLDRFTREKAEFLLGESGNAAAALDDLQRKNSFITRDDSGTYVLHSLLRQYVGALFDRLPPATRQGIHSRCADWFIRQNDAPSAIEACYRAGEYERGLELLESDMSRNLVTENSGFFVEMFKACPEEILERHMGAAFKYAIAAFATGDYQSFGSQIAWIGKKCAERARAEGEDDPATMIWRGELEFLLSLGAYNDIAAMSAHHRRANELLGRPTRLFGPESPWTLGCPSVLFMFHKKSGRLDEELALMDECLPHYYALASMHGAGGEQQMRAEALYQRGDFVNAAVACRRAEAMAVANGQISVVLCCMFLRLRLALLEGRRTEGERLIKEMRGLLHDRRNFFLLHTVDICEAYLHVFNGNPGGEPDRIPNWLRFGPDGERRLYTFAGGYYYLAHGRVLLHMGEYSAVTGLFSWLVQSGAFANHLVFTMNAHVYVAAANAALGLKAEAEAALRAALDLALPDGLYMPFVENADLLPQLKTLSRKKPYREGVRRILRLALALGRISVAGTAKDAPKTPAAALSLLTKRERELVRRALSGKTYPEIAVALGLAPSTVKRVFATVFKKLGVHSRKELAARFTEK